MQCSYLWAQGLWKGDEYLAYAPARVRTFLYVALWCSGYTMPLKLFRCSLQLQM